MQSFIPYVQELMREPKVRQMDGIAHHTERISCLNHCLYVAYVGYVLACHLGGDARAVARGGLLHDLYLRPWQGDRSLLRHLFTHPDMAARNARELNITRLEEGIIRKHMWPVTLTRLPTRREEIIVSLADKICALSEVTGVYWRLRCCRALKRLCAN